MLRKIMIAAALFLTIIAFGGWLHYQYEGERLEKLQSSNTSDGYTIRSDDLQRQPFTDHLPFRPREYIRIIRYYSDNEQQPAYRLQ